MSSQAPINLLRECPMDVLIWSLFPVSEILLRARFLSCKCVFSFTTLLSVLCWRRSKKWKCREDSTVPTLFSCEHPAIPGEVPVQQKKMIKKSSVPLFKAILCLAICLSATEHATFCSHPSYFTPSALWYKLPLAYTADLTVRNDNLGSYEQFSSCIRTSEVTGAWRWIPPTPYLGGYYS